MLDLTCPEMRFLVDTLRDTAQLARQIQTDMAMMNLTKRDMSPVTVADFALQAVTGLRLHERFPDATLVAEERSARLREPANTKMLEAVTRYVNQLLPHTTADAVCAAIDRGAGTPGERFWTLDPIDGTKGYRRGGQYAVALAVVDRGRVLLGGLACPSLQEDCLPGPEAEGVLIAARRGQGAWRAPLNAPAPTFTALRVSECDVPKLGRLLRSAEAAHTDVAGLETLAAQLGIDDAAVVRMDSQAKYATLAAGEAEFLFRLLSPSRPDYRECIWDQAAGTLVLEEAGGLVTDLAGRPLDFSTGAKLTNNTGVVATNGRLHDAALAALTHVKSDGVST